MSSVNKLILVGNLGQDPQVRYASNGSAVTTISIATTHAWKNDAGEKQERTSWHRCTAFGKLAEVIGEYAKKGRQVYVEGRLEYREWEKEGQKHVSAEMVIERFQLLGRREDGDGEQRERPAQASAQARPAAAATSIEDDIPF